MKFSLAAVVAAIAFSASAQAQEVPSEIAALSSQFSGILNGGGLPTGAALQSDIGVLTSALANPTVSSYVFNNPSLSALAQGALALAGANGGASSGASSAASETSSGSMASSATSMASSAASGASGAVGSIASGASSAIAGATSAAGSAAAGATSAAGSAAPKSGAESLSSLRGALAPVAVVLGVVAGAVAVL